MSSHVPATPSGNLFDVAGGPLAVERIEVLVDDGVLRVERIISTGHSTPPGDWYDQDRHEWVAVLRGSAGVRFEGDTREHVLHAGDYLLIPAHRRHRVEWTDPREPTVWLAVHYASADA